MDDHFLLNELLVLQVVILRGRCNNTARAASLILHAVPLEDGLFTGCDFTQRRRLRRLRFDQRLRVDLVHALGVLVVELGHLADLIGRGVALVPHLQLNLHSLRLGPLEG